MTLARVKIRTVAESERGDARQRTEADLALGVCVAESRRNEAGDERLADAGPPVIKTLPGSSAAAIACSCPAASAEPVAVDGWAASSAPSYVRLNETCEPRGSKRGGSSPLSKLLGCAQNRMQAR